MENQPGYTANNTSKNADEVKMPLTVTKKDGNQFEHEVINLDHPHWCPMSGMVEIFPVKIGRGLNGAIRHQNDVSFSVVRDKEGGFYIGMVNGTDRKTGELKFDKISVRGSEVFDLSIRKQRHKFICFKYGPFYKDSPNRLTQSRTIYDITDHEKAAQDYLKNRSEKRTAGEIAESLWDNNLIEFAYALGFDPKTYSPTQLHVEVMKFAENETKVNGKTGAQRFMEAYNSDTRHELVTFKRALATGLIINTVDKGYSYNGLSMGFTEGEAVAYLKQQPTTCVSLDTQSRGKADKSTQITDSVGSVKVTNEYEAKIARLEKELEASKKAMLETSTAALEIQSQNDLSKADPELAELILEAKSLKVNAPHLVGKNDVPEIRKQKLRDKIEEARKSKNN